MRRFEEKNPAVIALYFFICVFTAMFSFDPIIIAVSLFGGLLYFDILPISRKKQTHIFSAVLFLITAFVNPFVSHKGATILFFINDMPVTGESIYYGLTAAGAIVSALYWFRCFFVIMTSDRLLYIFSFLSPKLSLALSMALRFVPLMKKEYRRISLYQKTLGLYRDGNIIDSIKGRMIVFDALITRFLEGGIVTALSMEARGYGCCRRTRYSLFRFRSGDAVLAAVSVSLGVYAAVISRSSKFVFYPESGYTDLSALAVTGYSAYLLLVLLPAIINAKEALRWKYLLSKM